MFLYLGEEQANDPTRIGISDGFDSVGTFGWSPREKLVASKKKKTRGGERFCLGVYGNNF